MFKGFYNLTSGMLTQQRHLDVISNNMMNFSTAGYKGETYTSSTFQEVLYNRVGNKDKEGAEQLGTVSYIRATDRIYTDYTQGSLDPTDLPLDCAIDGDGFFAVRGADGAVAYTRMGNFSLDSEGYLALADYGRVLDNNGEEILLGTDKVIGNDYGHIFLEDTGRWLAQVGAYSFEDNALLERGEQDFFVGEGAQPNADVTFRWGYTERSNVSMVEEMTEMMSAQRELQSAAQIIKLYDTLMSKAATDVGRLNG